MQKAERSPKTGGRKKGTPNKISADARAAIALLAERNVGKLEGWLVQVAKEDPAKAADIFLRVIEYHIPKLARTDVTTNGKELPRSVIINVAFGKDGQ
jgi:hypothetical protein